MQIQRLTSQSRTLRHLGTHILGLRATVYQKWLSKPKWRSSACPAVGEKELREACHWPERAFLCGQGCGDPTTRDLGSRPRPLAHWCLLAGVSLPGEPPIFRAPCCTDLAELIFVLDQIFKRRFSLWIIPFRTGRVVLEGVRGRDSCRCCFTGCFFREGTVFRSPTQHGFWSLSCIPRRISVHLLCPGNRPKCCLQCIFTKDLKNIKDPWLGRVLSRYAKVAGSIPDPST